MENKGPIRISESVIIVDDSVMFNSIDAKNLEGDFQPILVASIVTPRRILQKEFKGAGTNIRALAGTFRPSWYAEQGLRKDCIGVGLRGKRMTLSNGVKVELVGQTTEASGMFAAAAVLMKCGVPVSGIEMLHTSDVTIVGPEDTVQLKNGNIRCIATESLKDLGSFTEQCKTKTNNCTCVRYYTPEENTWLVLKELTHQRITPRFSMAALIGWTSVMDVCGKERRDLNITGVCGSLFNDTDHELILIEMIKQFREDGMLIRTGDMDYDVQKNIHIRDGDETRHFTNDEFLNWFKNGVEHVPLSQEIEPGEGTSGTGKWYPRGAWPQGKEQDGKSILKANYADDSSVVMVRSESLKECSKMKTTTFADDMVAMIPGVEMVPVFELNPNRFGKEENMKELMKKSDEEIREKLTTDLKTLMEKCEGGDPVSCKDLAALVDMREALRAKAKEPVPMD